MHALGNLFFALDGLVDYGFAAQIENLLLLFEKPLLRLLVILARGFIRGLNLLLRGSYRRGELLVYLVERLAGLYHARMLFLVALFRRGDENLLARLVRQKLAYLGELRDKRKVCEVFSVALEFLHEIPLGGGRVVGALVGGQNGVDVAQFVSVHVVEVFERNGLILLASLLSSSLTFASCWETFMRSSSMLSRIFCTRVWCV